MLIKPLAYEWLETKRVSVKITSWDHYRYLLDKILIPRIGKFDAGKFTIKDLQAYANDVASIYGQSSLKGAMFAFKSVHRYGARVGYIKPWADYTIENPRAKDYHTYKKVNCLSQRQAERLMVLLEQIVIDPVAYPVKGHPKDAQTHDKDRRYALGCMLALGCGERISEVCGCIPSYDIDYDDEVITVERIAVNQSTEDYRAGRTKRKKTGNKVKRLEVGINAPKTEKSWRDIPLPEGFIDIFETYAPKDGYLIPGKTGSKQPLYSGLSRWFRNLMRAQTEIKYIKFHGMRHTYATILLDKGVDPKTLSELLGHASVDVTLRLYVHPDEKSKKRAVRKHKWKRAEK